MSAQTPARFADLGADGAPARLGLMGGTFDPVHVGHLRIAEEVREALGLDAVLFIPAGNPVFKKGQHVTDAQLRLEMCRLAVAGNPHFDVSSIEVDRQGDTFTVDTLRELRASYPENVQFFFIVGADVAATVGKWRGCAELAGLTSLAVAAGRPDSPGAEELAAAIRAAGPFDFHIVEASTLEVSSSGLREAIGRGEACRYLVPDAVRSFIREKGLYAAPSPSAASISRETPPADDADVLSKGFFKARKAELAGRVAPKRFEHSLNVSDTCAKLAKRFGVDVKKARLAGLLHDWDKGMDDDEARARVRELGMQDEIDAYTVEHMPRVLHGITAARALGEQFPGIPRDVLQAISRHTTAAPDMSPLDMVLYIADAIEPGRKYGRIDELRAAVDSSSLEELYFLTYEYWVFLLFERRQALHPDTIRIWNAHADELARQKQAARQGGKAPGHSKGTQKK